MNNINEHTNPALVFTGERFVPEVHGNIELEHLHRYLQAGEIAAGKVVLDIACGEGYGSAMLANEAEKVVGVDISADAIKHARKRYKKENLQFMVGSCSDVPLSDASVDMVVSFETIEHHDQHEEMMREIKRVLRPAGVLLISSPDKYNYSVEPGYSNPYHVKELYQHEFKQLLADYFKNITYFGQRIIYGSNIFAESLETPALSYFQEDKIIKEASGIVEPIYWIALASDSRLPILASGVLEQPINNSEIIQSWRMVVTERDGQIADLNQAVAVRDGQIADLNRVVAQRDGQIANLHQVVAERDGKIANLDKTVSECEGQIADRDQTVSDREGRLVVVHQKLAEKQLELLRMSDWAAGISVQPFRYFVRRTGSRVVRAVYRRLPISSRNKWRLRAFGLRLLRSQQQTAIHKSAVDTLASTSFCAPIKSVPRIRALTQTAIAPADIFLFSVVDWHFRIQRPQHLAREFARAGHRVFFFTNHFVDQEAAGYDVECLDQAMQLYQVKLYVSGNPPIYFSPPTPQVIRQLLNGLAKFIDASSSCRCVALVQHAFWYSVATTLPNARLVYDCMDHHEGFGDVPNGLIESERALLKKADLVVVTSGWLEKFAREYNLNVCVVRNAGEYSHFSERPSDVFADYAKRRVIGYYGAIAGWFDAELIERIARAFPKCLLLLIGDDTCGLGKRLKHYENVRFTGEVKYSQLPYYLYGFDVCILPFRVIPLTLATNPVKVYEYLAAGKPVVSSNLPELKQFGGVVNIAEGENDFLAQIQGVLDVLPESKEREEERRCFAASQTWVHRVADLRNAIEACLSPKVSVIVLTYNNLDLTRACLSSLDLYSDYPNLEIIVVDNASLDGTPEFLKLYAQDRSDIRLILNAENRGFAAGNNQGLAAATGEYLVLLNNDTVVTFGWIRTLMRHLISDPSIGLVGPVTNNIGNEARVEILYRDVEVMPEVARQITLGKMGHTFEIRTLAFFCVMCPHRVYEKVGPIDEAFGLGFFEDDDYCRRVESHGWRIVCAEDVFVHHHLSASFNKLKQDAREALFVKNKEIYEAKWGRWMPHEYRR